MPERNTRFQVLRCPECGEVWEAAYRRELGTWRPESGRERCPECGREGEPTGDLTYRSEFESEGESQMAEDKKKEDTNVDGVVEAALGGEPARKLVDLIAADEGLLDELEIQERPEADIAELTMRDHAAREKRRRRGTDDDAQAAGCPAPGSKVRSKGRGRGLARGRGRGPMGAPAGGRLRLGMGPARAEDAPGLEEPVEETDEPTIELADELTSFGDFIKQTEACPPKKKKESLDEDMHEFAAPERQDVIQWARGVGPKRTSEKLPFYFDGDAMYSRKKKIAERDVDAKTARVLSPGILDAVSGRHANLCKKGLGYCGYQVEMVEEL